MKKRNNPKVEAMKERSLIVENERKNLHTPKFYINEQEEEINTTHDRAYDYKKDGDKYFFRKKDEENWKQTDNSAVKGVFGDKSSSPQQTTTDKPKDIKGFQQYVINTIGDKTILGKGGDSGYGDDGIWGTKTVSAWEKYGEKYEKGDKPKLSNKDFVIDVNEISTTDTTKLSCKAGSNDCAQFVNDFNDKVDNVGNAWTAHDTDSAGKRVWSAYRGLDTDTINKIVGIYKDIKQQGGANDNITDSSIIKDIKSLQNEIIGKKGKPDDLQIGDIVGLYYEPSEHHERAFEEAADHGPNGYFIDKDPSRPGPNGLGNGNSFAFNTHVGTVGMIKDGVPIILHNTGKGNIISDPANTLNIVWVKRIGNSTTPIKDKDGNWYSDIISYFS